MKLYFKQRAFSWFDSYDVYCENGAVAYTVKGQLSWGHCLHVLTASGQHIGTVQERVFTWLPKFELYENDRYCGSICKRWSLFKPRYEFDCNGWRVFGDFFEWDYSIVDANGVLVAKVEKQIFHFTDTYVLDIVRPQDALLVLMFTLAVDAEKCSRN